MGEPTDAVDAGPPLTVVRATDPPPRGPRVWAGGGMLRGSLGLIGLGGCHLIGILLLLRPDFINPQLPHTDWDFEAEFLLISLNVMSVVCLVGALVLFVLGVRALLRVSEEKVSTT